MSSIFFPHSFFRLLCPAGNASTLKKHEKPYLFYHGSWEFAAGVWIQRTCGFRKANEQRLFLNGSWEFAAGVWIQRTCGFKKVNEHELFLNGSWEILPGQPGNAAAEGWPARFLYERWEMGNGKRAMAHRPVTMDHRKV